MSYAPFFTPQKLRFRDGTSSAKQNEQNQNIFYDLIELFNIANEQDLKLKELEKFYYLSTHYTQEHIDAMKRELESLKEDLWAAQHPGAVYKKILYPMDARTDEEAETYERAFLDTQHDVITMPYSSYSTSKLYLYDDINREYILPNTIQYDITPKADNVSIKENDFKNALVPDDFKIYHREYIYFSGIQDHVTATIILKLPENIISNRDVNTIYIHPFPLNTMDILNIEYQLDGAWKVLPGFQPIENIDNTKFCFSPIEISAIRLTLRQRHFIEKGGQRIFHIGIKELGVFHNDYQNGTARFEIPVEFNPRFKNKELIGIEPRYQNEGTLSVHQKDTKLLTFKIYEVDENGKLNYISDTFPMQIKTNKILLKGLLSFDRNTRSTPALTSVELLYKGDS